MSDVEWYVEIEGQRTGPVSPSDLVAMYQAGRLPGNAMATTTRMQGDWVTIADLVEAYRELNQTLNLSKTSSLSDLSDSHGPSFQAPPRPTEQLEASKIINLNTLPPSQAPMDATESLFLAIQAVREKAAAKNAITQSPVLMKTGNYPKDPGAGRNQLIAMVVVVVMIGGYGITRLLKTDPAKSDIAKPEIEKVETSPIKTESFPATETKVVRPAKPANLGSPKSKLLTEGGGGSVRTAPPVTAVMPKGGGAIRRADTETRDRRDLRDYSRDNRDNRDARDNRDHRDSRDNRDKDPRDNSDRRESNAPTIRDEFGEAIDSDDSGNNEMQRNHENGLGNEHRDEFNNIENDAGFPSTMEGVAPEQ